MEQGSGHDSYSFGRGARWRRQVDFGEGQLEMVGQQPCRSHVARWQTSGDVVDEAATQAEILHKVRVTGCQLLVLGGILLDESGLELLADLRRLHPSLRILIFSIQTSNELGVRTLKAGASGYLTLNSTMDELVKAVRVVANGRKYICSEMAESLAMGITNSQNEPPHRVYPTVNSK